MIIRKNTNCHGNVSIWVQYPHAEYPNGNHLYDEYENGIQIVSKILNINAIGATINRRGHYHRFGPGKKTQESGLAFSFAVEKQHADLFDENVFALMK